MGKRDFAAQERIKNARNRKLTEDLAFLRGGSLSFKVILRFCLRKFPSLKLITPIDRCTVLTPQLPLGARCNNSTRYYIPLAHVKSGTVAFDAGCRRCRPAGTMEENMEIVMTFLETRSDLNKFKTFMGYASRLKTRCPLQNTLWILPFRTNEPVAVDLNQLFQDESERNLEHAIKPVYQRFEEECDTVPTLCVRHSPKKRGS